MNEFSLQDPNLLSLQQGIPQETPVLPLLFPEMSMGRMEQTPPQDETEQWATCADYDVIQVSTLGRFKSSKGRIIKGTLKDNGYLDIGFLFNGKVHTKLAHRLVAKTFLTGSPEQIWVNHKNKVRNDNRVSNLEWNTPSENAKHSKAKG